MHTWLSRWLSGKESACQWRRLRRHKFDPWVRKMPWRRKWQPTPGFSPGESHVQRTLEDCSPWGCKELDTTERPSTNTCAYTQYKRITTKKYPSALESSLLASRQALLLVSCTYSIFKKIQHDYYICFVIY